MASSDQEIFDGLVSIVAEEADVDPSTVQRDRSFTELGVDSLSLMKVVLAAEDRFGVRIPDADAAKLVTVGDAVTCIGRLTD